MLSCLLIVIFCIVLSATFSGLETGSYVVNRVRLHHWVEQKKPFAATLARNLKKPQLFVFTTLIGNNIVVYIATGSVTEFVGRSGIAGEELELLWNFIPWSAEVAATAILMLPLFIFAEVGPKNLFRVKADYLMYETASIQRFFIIVCYPVTVPLRYFATVLTRSKNKDYSSSIKNITLHRLRFFLRESRDKGTITERQDRMINNAIMLQKKMVTDAMVPISKLVALEESDVSVESCVKIFKRMNVNSIPVYRDSIQNITGVIHVFDVISCASDKVCHLSNNVQKICSVSQSDDMQEAFYKIQSEGERIAAVRNSRGKAIGVVRLKDIVRNITGAF